ncbi:MAG: energy transducer TonB, partial [Sphingopyxis sp.]|nr:energy transducer TonB [Sphingopyxis sp.]
ETPPPPRAATPAIIEDPRVSLWGYGSPRPQGVPKPLRSAMAANDVKSWLPASDPAVISFLADPQARAQLNLRLTIDAAGRVIACAVNQRWRDDPPPAFTDGLCDRVSARARFTPAIDDAGFRVPDTLQLVVMFERVRRRPGAEPTPLIVEREPDPIPMVDRERWPPWSSGSVPVFAALPLADGGAAAHAADAAPWAGIELREGRDGQVEVRVVRSSEDRAFNGLAYGLARRSGPTWPADLPPNRRRLMVHFTSVNGAPQAILPVSERPTDPSISAADRAGLIAALTWPRATDATKARLRLELDLDNEGRVTLCRIAQSSGSDAGDASACSLIRENARFEPRRDIFGWPHPAHFRSWALVEAP